MSIRTNISDARFNRIPPETVLSTATPTTFGETDTIAIPTNSVWNFRLANATVDFTPSGNLLDYAPNQNVIQGGTLTSPNTATGTTRSFIIASESSSLTNCLENAIIATSGGTINSSNAASANWLCSLLGTRICNITGSNQVVRGGIQHSRNCNIQRNGTGSVGDCVIAACDSVNMINNSATNASTVNMISASNGLNITVNSGNVSNTSIVGSSGGAITQNGTSGLGSISLGGCASCSITSGVTGGFALAMAGVESGTINISGSGARNSSMFIGGVNGCTITAVAGTGNTNNIGVIGAAGTTITNNGTSSSAIGYIGVVGSDTTSIVNSGTSTTIGNVFIGASSGGGASVAVGAASLNRVATIASTTGTFNQTSSGSLLNCAIIASNLADINSSGASSSGSCLIAAGQNSHITNSNYCVALGQGANITGFTNVLAFNATATSNSQIIANTRLDLLGATNHFTMAGYVNPASGYLNPYRTVGTATSLNTTDSILVISAGSVAVTVPQATVFATNFPTGTVRKYCIKVTAGNSGSTVSLSGGDTFRRKINWTTHTLGTHGETFNLLFVNDPTNPYWEPKNNVGYSGMGIMSTANNFGLTPPKADASLLPTSTSAANHATLTTTSFVTFNSITSVHTPAFTISGQGITFNIPGTYTIGYTIELSTIAGAGNYVVRADLCTTAGTQVANSFSEVGGANTVGTKTWTVTASPLYVNAANTYTVRISQENTLQLTTNASIIAVRMIISGIV